MQTHEPAQEDNAPRPCSGIVPPIWFLAAVVTMALAHFFLPGAYLAAWPWNLLGALPTLAGITVSVTAWLQFRFRQTTVNPYGASASLVTDGIYRYTRNPMYLGMTLILAGTALGLGSLTPWLAAVVFPFWLYGCFIRAEEAALAARFGEEFEEYRRRTRCWV
jgi:protein-S-isoprenylcysteine O-methyltransferase Ste14